VTTSERAIAKLGIKDMPDKDKPISERYRLAAKEWVKAEKIASFMEQNKDGALSKMKNAVMREHGEMSEAKAERLVKSSKEWEEYLQAMVNLRAEANEWRQEMKTLELEDSERMDKNANARHEARLNR
jgi:hypothetical protein